METIRIIDAIGQRVQYRGIMGLLHVRETGLVLTSLVNPSLVFCTLPDTVTIRRVYGELVAV